ncbi:glycosyltransferase family 4 protein [Frigoribacterium sp. CFBP 13712]|uniref:glycosyltransferase family 4 protein n=1 Tax=Frigoribacterium sp. CFBP 13712 TaxID=2775309 RepID=UPI001783C116|nr:glycosyltransferase family 4 protein [Frigoribacterium sp. CFBP 13712]
MSYLPFGVDSTFYAPQPYPQQPLVFSAGGDRDRDPETLFAALAQIVQSRPDVEVVVQSRSELAPPPGVRKVPYLSHVELKDMYAKSSVVLIATQPNEHASGMTVSLESMATARPVVMTKTPGIDDYIVDGVTGSLVQAGDSRAMAAASLRLLSDTSGARDVGIKGRVRVEERFTSALMAAKLSSIMNGEVS